MLRESQADTAARSIIAIRHDFDGSADFLHDGVTERQAQPGSPFVCGV